MVDPRDLGLVTQVRSPHAEAPTIYLYEAVPGGIGLSERLWTRHDELVAGAAALIAGVRLRRRLPGLHRPAARARRRRQGASPCACSASSARPTRPARRGRGVTADAATTSDGLGSDLARRLARYRAATGTAAPPTDDAAPPPAPVGGPGGAAGRDARRRGRGDADGPRSSGSRGRPTDIPVDRARLADAARPAAAGPSARLPRHGDDRAGDGGRHGRLPHRPRLVGGRAVPPGPAPAPRPRRRAGAARRARRATSRRDALARDLQRPRLRLAAARDPLPAGPSRRARSTTGHLDLLPVVRRVFRHRMDDARLRTVERSCSA